ncbi:MAG TPA: hypothetical protein VLF66_02695, partial [Thermoanaerobaculia bacterium]|nr:hypothetical protein [Thermoanaerobaculia bacterium]
MKFRDHRLKLIEPPAHGLRGPILGLLLLVPFLPTPLAAQAVSCGGSRISYVQTGNGPDVTQLCSAGSFTAVCQVPVLGSPVYSFDGGCSPY